jgi:hypothetical protein
MRFRLYDAETGGTMLWDSGDQSVSVDEGLFNVELDINHSDFNGQELWLEIQVKNEKLSRQELLPAPYALSLRPGAEIVGSIGADSVLHAENKSPTNLSSAIRGQATGGGTNNIYGVRGESDGEGIYAAGVSGWGYSDKAKGVVGIGGNLGSYNSKNGAGGSFSGLGYGVYGEGKGSSENYGVYGEAHGGTTNYGVYGEAHGGTTNYGVYGRADGGTTNWAGYFWGKVNVTSDLYASKVGIGTESPSAELEIASSGEANFKLNRPSSAVAAVVEWASGGTLDWAIVTPSGGDDLLFRDAGGTKVTFQTGGNVGIGTANPEYKMDVVGNRIRLRDSTGAGAKEIVLRTDGAAVDLSAENARLFIASTEHTIIQAWGGNVGIGTASPNTKLHIMGGSDASLDSGSGYLVLGSESGVNIVIDNNEIIARNNGSSSNLWLNKDSGNVIMPVLQITGGSDLSEQFEIQGNQANLLPSPGMVVCIDPEHPGKLIVSTKAYDRTVAGIISGAGGIKPGMLMGQSDSASDGWYPVALVGRVYVWADASYGSIEPGDLLTTSDTPGHAMKVTDYERAKGAIIGKAMSSLEEGRGLILVLVSLQ